MMIRVRIFLSLTALELFLLLLLLFDGYFRGAVRAELELPQNRQLAQVLQLTDLALWTEARYTRHPSQADRFTPFQESPSAFEHFPAGSVIGPPADRQP